MKRKRKNDHKKNFKCIHDIQLDSIMISLEVQVAIGLWFKSKKGKGENPNPKLLELMPLLFKTLSALHIETRKLPFLPKSGATNRPKDKPDAFIFGLWLDDHDYITLRSILALAGDLINVLGKLTSLPNLLELGQFLSPLRKQAEKFRHARNFFTHMMMF